MNGYLKTHLEAGAFPLRARPDEELLLAYGKS